MSDSESEPSRRIVRAQKNYQKTFEAMLRSRGILSPRVSMVSMREFGFEPQFRVDNPPWAHTTVETSIGLLYGLSNVFNNTSLFFPDRVAFELFSPDLSQILEGEFFDLSPESESDIRALDAKPIWDISQMHLRFRTATASRPVRLEDPTNLVWNTIPIQPEHVNELANSLRWTTSESGLLSVPRFV